jgi:hypothetical protein
VQLAESIYAGQDCAFALHDACSKPVIQIWANISVRRTILKDVGFLT